MTIRELHKLAYRRVPRERVHDVLHEQALALGRASLRECTPAELDELAMHLRQLPTRRPTGPEGDRPSAYGPRQRWSGQPTPETLQRRRPGSGGDPAMKMISPRQQFFIFALASEIGWTDEELSIWIRKYFAADSLATSAQAQDAIKRLLKIKAQKAGRK